MEDKIRNNEIVDLKIQEGWKFFANLFFKHVDPSLYDFDQKTLDESGNANDFTEDLLMLKNDKLNRILDLGWYMNGDVNGQFRIVMSQKFEADEWDDIFSFSSKSQSEIIEKIQECLSEDFLKEE